MSSGFITETEIAEARKKRQEDWERVRKADDPLEAPEQPYDPRSLYERLQEQKQRKELEYEEAHKLKNMIKGLDDDEIEFLDLVDRTKLAADRRKNLEEEKELNDYRNRVASLQEKSLDQKLQAEIGISKPKSFSSNRSSQTKLLKGVIVTKSDSKKRKASEDNENMENSDNKKLKSETATNGHASVGETGDSNIQVNDKIKTDETEPSVSTEEECSSSNNTDSINANKNAGLTCIAILPGLGYYEESSSDECSSSSDQDSSFQNCSQHDLLGRKIVKKDKETRKYSSHRRRMPKCKLYMGHF
ncbi:hypothetical protein ILUMI_03074 [Ignelater luminosus]|uniref:FAM192A/Fyv6 N-terminal domain-containing protein n=1 Tax=Ignelater luminosus TaxID=2038154 RepID=A0A8K0DBM9_IGNLU|nr:hypothetical protein ILUMI_03074 [Ignelater luminosus]